MPESNVALFIPCLVDLSTPCTGIHSAELLEAAGYHVSVPDGQTCCGQPAFNTGYHEETLAYARRFLKIFGDPSFDAVVGPTGSCVAMVRSHYGDLPLDGQERKAWEALRTKVFEFCEFFSGVVNSETFRFSREVRVAYHDPCHLLRELDGGSHPRRLLESIEGITLLPLPGDSRCCGFGGTFSVKHAALSSHMTDIRLKELLCGGDTDVIVSADPSCVLQLRGRLEALGETTAVEHIVDFLHGSWQRD